MRKILLTLLLFNLACVLVIAHPFNAASYVVVDTDGGIDDYRALCLLLSAPDVRVLAVTASTGVLPAEVTALKVQELLKLLHHEGIPVAINNSLPHKAGGCSPAMDFQWGDPMEATAADFMSMDSLGRWMSTQVTKKITWIQLGSLSTMMYFQKHFPTLVSNSAQVIWSTETKPHFGGFNHRVDTTLAPQLGGFDIPVRLVQGEGNYNDDFLQLLPAIGSETANCFALSFNDITANSPFGMRSYDEMAVIYLHFPEKFQIDTTLPFSLVRYNSMEDKNLLIGEILSEKNTPIFQIMRSLPTDTNFYQPDVRAAMSLIIQKHGMSEWVSAVNTFELHRHIGIYALVGAKMGLRALTYFGAGIDELEVVSQAGFGPPISCMNDGIQVSTGATLGHGLIKIEEHQPTSSARFTYLGKTISLSLRPEYRKKIKDEISQLVQQYGLESDEYWLAVRRNALRYWLEMDRNEMFDIVVLN